MSDLWGQNVGSSRWEIRRRRLSLHEVLPPTKHLSGARGHHDGRTFASSKWKTVNLKFVQRSNKDPLKQIVHTANRSGRHWIVCKNLPRRATYSFTFMLHNCAQIHVNFAKNDKRTSEHRKMRDLAWAFLFVASPVPFPLIAWPCEKRNHFC